MGQQVIRFYDLDGHIVEVCDSMKLVINRLLESKKTMDDISKKTQVSIEDLKKLLR